LIRALIKTAAIALMARAATQAAKRAAHDQPRPVDPTPQRVTGNWCMFQVPEDGAYSVDGAVGDFKAGEMILFAEGMVWRRVK
jgi:hypothetical protein